MKFEYTGRHLEVTPAIRSHVEGHFERIDHLFGKDDNHAHIIIEVERGLHRSEIVVKWRNQILTATSTEEDMYQSLSQTIAKIEKQALRLKNKIIDRSHKALKVGEVAPVGSDNNARGDAKTIISVDNYKVKPMTPEEASLLLDTDDDQFLVFRNAVNQGISVLYKRQDGNFGLIQP